MKFTHWLACFFSLITLVYPVARGQTFAIDATSAAHALASYLDAEQQDIQNQLALMAQTPAAQAGDWDSIKPLFENLSRQHPGGWFFIRPDGSYFSLEQGLTKLNLSDRPYFQPLFAGQTISGFPILSRSTGRKSAFFAAPVKVDGNIAGAIAGSVFLDEWYKRIEASVPVPSNFFWRVVNSDGVLVMDAQTHFVLENATDRGSPSRRSAMEMIKSLGDGVTSYEDAGVVREVAFRRLSGVPWTLMLERVEPEALARLKPELRIRLEQIRDELSSLLAAMDTRMADALKPWQGRPFEDEELRPALRDIVNANKLATDVGFVNTEDILIVIEPSDYQEYEGSDLSETKRSEYLSKTRKPFLSDSFMSVEGIPTVVIVHPLFDENDELSGSVSMLINPVRLFEAAAARVGLPEDHEVWAMQKDGKIIYDANRSEIGRMLFEDPIYAAAGNLIELGRRMVAQPSGKGDYVFASAVTGEDAMKICEWETVGLHGTEWRIVLVHRPYDAR